MANGTEANLKVLLARQQATFKTGSYLKQSCHISDVNKEAEGKAAVEESGFFSRDHAEAMNKRCPSYRHIPKYT